MSTDKILRMHSADSDATEKLAEIIGRNLRGGEVIELSSDLGGGKTTFMRGLARGAGSNTHVSSPTFKISNIYKTPKFDIVHYDFYRLDDPGLMSYELAEYVGDSDYVVAVEWASVVHDILPQQRLTIRIQTVSEHERDLVFTVPADMTYLIKGLDT